MRVSTALIEMPRTIHNVNVAPEIITWAINYSRREDDLRRIHPNLADWESGRARPTVKQLGQFAKDSRVPIGYFYLPRPPTIEVDIPDMRTVGNQPVGEPSPDLIQTVFECQRRQDWFVDYAKANGLVDLTFVGSYRITDSPEDAAAEMRRVMNFGVEQRNLITRREYRKALVDAAESAGVLVMISGVVGNNTSRPLDIDEFRGFALSDPMAPVVFVNANDSLGAQLFTLAHELAHVWLGESAISAPDGTADPTNDSELWCNAVAAEFLVPHQELREVLNDGDPIESMETLGRHFKVSDQVILRRLVDARAIDRQTFRNVYDDAVNRDRHNDAQPHGGGNYYANVLTRVSRRLAERLYWETKSGKTFCRKAYRLLGIKNGEQFDKLAAELTRKGRMPAG